MFNDFQKCVLKIGSNITELLKFDYFYVLNFITMISEFLDGIENRLDIIEELLDSLEDNDVNVESFREKLGKVWDELSTLNEEYS